MDVAIQGVLGALLGILLSVGGISYKRWLFYAVFLVVIAMRLVDRSMH